MPFVFGDEPSNTGDSIGVQCMANKGDLPIDIRWIQNTQPIVSGENGIAIIKLNQRTSSLSINSLEGMHRGIYKCVVSNKAGTAEYSSELQVNGLLANLCKSTHIARIAYANQMVVDNVIFWLFLIQLEIFPEVDFFPSFFHSKKYFHLIYRSFQLFCGARIIQFYLTSIHSRLMEM